MSNTGKFVDQAPFIRNAGVTTATGSISTDHSLRQDIYFKPRTSTPEHIKKYRKSIREIPGIKQHHYGVYDDPKIYDDMLHGDKTKNSDHVTDCIKGGNHSGVGYFLNSYKEEKYARNQREPLGKSIIRNYKFPDKVTETEFKFGIPTGGYVNAKDLLYAGTGMTEPEEVKTLYNKSHGLTDPGQQKDRSYKWYVDKNSHVFGKYEPREENGAQKSLTFDFLEANFPKTKVVDKRLEDYRQATSDMVGRSKFRGTLPPTVEETHIFGNKNVLGGTWNVAKCMHGDPEEKTESHLQPDPDLGKSVLYRSKLQNLQPKENEIDKTFGVPSIRYDLKREKDKLSICDLTNYGNEKDAFDLLYPNPHVTRGVDDQDLEDYIDRNQLRELLAKNNYTFQDSEYNILYELTLKNYPHPSGKVTYKAFISAMRYLKKEFMNYRTLIS